MTHSLWVIIYDWKFWTRKRLIRVSPIHVDFWEFLKLEIKKSVLWRKSPNSHQNESTLWLKYVLYALNLLQDSIICNLSLLQLYTTLFKIWICDIFRIFENFSKNVRTEFLLGSSKQDLRFTNKTTIYKNVCLLFSSWICTTLSTVRRVKSKLMTDLGDEMCWWRFLRRFSSPTSTIFLFKRRAQTFKRCHQHWNSVTNTHISSLTSLPIWHCQNWPLMARKVADLSSYFKQAGDILRLNLNIIFA